MNEFLSIAETKRIRQEMAVQETQSRRRADREMRDLKHRCAYCGSDQIATSYREGQVRPVTSEIATRWIGRAKTVGHIQVGRCRDCLNGYPAYDTNADAWAMHNRLKKLDLLAYVVGDPDTSLPALSWAGWEYRNRLAGGTEEVGDPSRPFSHLTDNVPDPSVIDWNPEIPSFSDIAS